MADKKRYADVLIEQKSDQTDRLFTYICEDDSIVPGSKVEVPFIKNNKKKGFVVLLHDEIPEGLEGKTIKKIISCDEDLSLTSDALFLAVWMRRRYFCRLYDAISCFLPPTGISKKGEKKVPKFEVPDAEYKPEKLTEEQIAVFGRIEKQVDDASHKIFLLHGVTGSGKTEIYMQVTEQVINKGKKAIILVPEISLTPQIIGRFIFRFGHERLAVLHSKLTKRERYDEWMRIKKGEVDIVIGARSAVFAPFENIGVIIVDEEHETSYSSDMTPKYDAKEVAMKRAKRMDAICILGSATPSIVSMYRAKTGIYEYLSMEKRYNETPLPDIKVADMREELKAGNLNIFSGLLYDKINESLEKKKQSILFLNRRGYSPYISCPSCGFVFKCEECGISMTYHKKANKAVCHFCGKSKVVPKTCPSCSNTGLSYFGIGTEKVEELAQKAFPDVAVARLDLDTASKRGSTTKILKDFEKQKTNILIGTQMVAKGLDYRNVDSVGIIAADVSLNIPDFRSSERTFQLITQASGRAGRGEEKGSVVVQTYSPDSYAIIFASKGDFEGFYNTEIMLREYLKYPPFSDILRVSVEADSPQEAEKNALNMRDWMLTYFGKDEEKNILGPIPSVIMKINDKYRFNLHIKMIPSMKSKYESGLFDYMRKNNTETNAKCRIMIDVNPFSLT